MASQKKAEYLKHYQSPPCRRRGGTFLTGDAESIEEVDAMSSVGFGISWPIRNIPGQFIHAGGHDDPHALGQGVTLLSTASTMPRAICALSSRSMPREEKAGSLTDAILLFCFHYDPSSGKYSLWRS